MAGDAKARIILEAQRRGEGAFTSFNADLGKIATRAAVIGTAAAAALALVTKAAFENIDALAKQADVLAIGTDKLAGLQLGAKLAGVEQDQLAKALERQRKTVYDASQGLTTATRALDQLGLKTEDLLKLDTHEQFLTIADALSKVENSTIRGGIAADVFGAKNVKLLALISEGREGLEGYVEQAERLGLAVNRVDAAKIEQANDAFELAKLRVQGLGNIIAIELAPAITALSNAFTNAGGDADEMGVTVRKVIDGIAYGAGLAADAFYGWQLIFQGLRVVTLEYYGVVIGGLADVVDIATAAGRAIKDALNIQPASERLAEIEERLAGLADKAQPGLKAGLERLRDQLAAEAALEVPIAVEQGTLRAIADSLQLSSEDAQRVFEQLAAATKPSEQIAAALATARAEAEKAAQATAALRQTAIDTAGGAGGTGSETDAEKRAREQAEKAAERQREQFAKDLEQVREFTLTREEVEIEAMERRQAILLDAYNRGLIDYVQYWELSADVAARGQERLTQIERSGQTARQKFEALSGKQKAASVIGTLAQLTAGTAQHSKKMFAVNKALGIADAIVNTARGVTQALAAYPPPLSFAMAAAVAAAGVAQVQAIRNTNFEGGGGGTTPSLAGSGGVVNSQPVQSSRADDSGGRPQTVVQFHVHGNVIGAGGRAELGEYFTELLHDHVERTDAILIEPSSRQGLTLRGEAIPDEGV